MYNRVFYNILKLKLFICEAAETNILSNAFNIKHFFLKTFLVALFVLQELKEPIAFTNSNRSYSFKFELHIPSAQDYNTLRVTTM